MKSKLILLSISILFALNNVKGQKLKENAPINASTKLMNSDNSKLTIGGYSEINYNQAFGNEIRSNGELDVQRLVLLFAYHFNDKVDFVTEIEFEHVKEVFVEQAFVRYRIKNWLSFRVGLLLIPMGIINEYHEPTTFNGVERPLIANKIIPTTWREIGAGFSGNFRNLFLKYQIYVVNGLNGYDGSGKFSGAGLRSGRQKGAESFMSSPSLSFKFDYYGIQNLKIGFAGYMGKSQSTMFDGLDTSEDPLINLAEQSRIGINLFGFDARYNNKGIGFRGTYFIANMSNTANYNALTGKDVGSAMFGYYLEASYDLMRLLNPNTKEELTFFARLERFNTQSDVESGTIQDEKYGVKQFTAGFGYRIADGVVLKTDFQFRKNQTQDHFTKQFNAGVAVWF